MKKYKVTGKVVSISSGIVELDKQQSDARIFALESLGGNRFGVLKTIYLKRGERFGYEGELPKGTVLELIDTAPKAKPGASSKTADEADRQDPDSSKK